MSCEQYSSGTNAEVELTAGTLPTGFCPTSLQEILEQFIASTTGTLPGNYSTFIISDSTPDPADQDKLWLKVDDTNCQPSGFYLFLNGSWSRVDGAVFYGAATSTEAAGVRTYSVAALDPEINWINTTSFNQIFVVKADASNTGAVKLTIPITGVSDVAVTKWGSTALEGYEILTGMLMLLTYDGTRFQLLNPRVNQVQIVNGLQNGSFEDDFDADGVPDQWERAGSVGHVLNGTRTTTDGNQCHGNTGYQITVPAASKKETLTTIPYIKCAENEVLYVSWKMRMATKNNTDVSPFYVKALFYDSTFALISSLVLQYDDLNTTTALPTASFTNMFGLVRVPSTANYMKLQIQVGDEVAGARDQVNLYFDDFRIGESINFPNESFFTVGIGTYDRGRFINQTTNYCLLVKCVGIGGTGGTGSAPNGGAGGGGGGTAIAAFYTEPSTTYKLSQTASGDFVFGTVSTAWLTAENGVSGVTTTPGAGGYGTWSHPQTRETENIQFVPIYGIDGGPRSGSDGGHGGASSMGVGGMGGTDGGTAASAGYGYGGGGGGGDSGAAGAAGSTGCIIISWF